MDPVWSRIVDNVTRNGDRPALEVGGDIVSYRDLYADAARIGATLTHPSTAILGQRTREGYAAVLGTVLRGATYVPLGTAFPVADNVHRLELVRCESLIVDATGLSALPALLEGLSRAITVLVLAEADIAELRVVHRRHRLLGRHDLAPAEGFEPLPHPPGRDFQIMFTSGSTGLPKAVRPTVGATNAFLDHVLAHYALTPEDRCSQIFDLAWDAHTHDYWVTWSAGACLVVPTAEQQLLPATFLREANLTLWYGVPSTLLAMQRQRALAPGVFPGLRHVLLVGEALPVDLAAAMQSAAPQARVTNAYGPTEASCTCLHYTFDSDRTPDEAENGVVPIGIPHRGTLLRVVDEHGDDVAPGEPGELWLAGAQLAAGYLHDPARTAAAFVTVGGERWYRTGDRVRRSVDDGPVVFLGRVDRQVQVFGSRIELGEVEAKLRDAEGVEAVAVVPWPVRGDVVEGLTAFVVGADLDERALRRWAKSRLHTLAVPRRFVRLDALPLNRNGKLDRDALIGLLRGHSMPTEN